MNESMEMILIEALDLMEKGLSVEEITARYPDEAAELRPFLLTAAALSNLASQPTLMAEQQSRRAFLATADRVAAQRARPGAAAGSWLRRLLTPALALLAVILLAGVGVVRASAATVPGDALYETKRFVEETRLDLTNDPERAAVLREQFRQERIREIERLMVEGREAGVSLTGVIETMITDAGGERWTVDGVAVVVGPGTPVDGRPAVGALVQVDGRTNGDEVTAERIMVLAGQMPEVEPTPRPTLADPTPEPQRPAATVESGDNDNDAGDGSEAGGQQPVAPTPAVPPSVVPATATPQPAPQPTSTQEDDNANDNGGGDDNANENDNGGEDNANDNDGGDDNANDNDGGDDNANDNDGSGNDNGGDSDNDNDSDDDNGNDNGDGGGSNDNGGSSNDNGDDSGGDD